MFSSLLLLLLVWPTSTLLDCCLLSFLLLLKCSFNDGTSFVSSVLVLPYGCLTGYVASARPSLLVRLLLWGGSYAELNFGNVPFDLAITSFVSSSLSEFVTGYYCRFSILTGESLFIAATDSLNCRGRRTILDA